ncbi:MAG: class I SAM-dependent methyltransferase [Deltaproteobacteria bacterium]|nr:class I SAM-dependent methyltransferase [Deltaproteobacteria bacterium]
MASKVAKKNIVYQSSQISEYYGNNRQRWDDLYKSEKWVFERIAGEKESLGKILDVGCACGGLGKALGEKYSFQSYTGVDINSDAITFAKRNINFEQPVTLINDDILNINTQSEYDIVASLGCADWNIETEKIVAACWHGVNEGGHLVISLRLTDREGLNDIDRSYQYIQFFCNEEKPERANYVVFNIRDAFKLFKNLLPQPLLIGAYGYWGKPSETARTPYHDLVFAVFYLQKAPNIRNDDIRVELSLPISLLF